MVRGKRKVVGVTFVSAVVRRKHGDQRCSSAQRWQEEQLCSGPPLGVTCTARGGERFAWRVALVRRLHITGC